MEVLLNTILRSGIRKPARPLRMQTPSRRACFYLPVTPQKGRVRSSVNWRVRPLIKQWVNVPAGEKPATAPRRHYYRRRIYKKDERHDSSWWDVARHAGSYALGAAGTALGGAAVGYAAKFAAEKAIDYYVAPYFHSAYSSKPQMAANPWRTWEPPIVDENDIDSRLNAARQHYRNAVERSNATRWLSDAIIGEPREWIDYRK